MQAWLTFPIHVSWRIATLCVGVVVGAATAPVLPVLFADTVFLMAAIGLALATMRWSYRWIALLALCAGLSFGIWRGAAQHRGLAAYGTYYGHMIAVQGVLREDSSFGVKGEQRFVLQHITIDGQVLPGEVWVSTGQKIDIKRGDTLTIRGKLSEGFGIMPATMYRAEIRAVYRPRPGDLARVVRDKFAESVRLAIPEPQASLGVGYLTGQRSALPADFDEQLRVVGLTHAVVASGYNLTILVTFARGLLARISKYLAVVVAGMLVFCFMMVTGLSPSMSRAGLVAGIGLAVWYYGRTVHPFVLLPVAAAITVAMRPAYAWGDLGWCLSFAAFAGVLVVAPLITRYFWEPGHGPPLLLQIFIETSAAQLTTLPIILYAFGYYSTYALPANMLVLPLVPLAMACTFIAGIAGLVAPAFAHILALPAEWLLTYMVGTVRKIADLPDAQKEMHFGLDMLIAGYLVLGLLCLYLWRRTGLDFRGDNKNSRIV